jgi:hypothetical protein
MTAWSAQIDSNKPGKAFAHCLRVSQTDTDSL